jgi:peroxiredoxin (alkyl hydroperoxide reductase subunit C)
MAVEAGQEAPDFDLQVSADTRARLADLRGEKNVLLVFHPYAFTGTCEAEACDIQDNLERYRDTDTEVVFVSCDPWPARQAWKKELGHDYTFASDFWPHGVAAQAYGVFDDTRGVSVRGTFLIGKDGVVKWALVHAIGEQRRSLVEESLAAVG